MQPENPQDQVVATKAKRHVNLIYIFFVILILIIVGASLYLIRKKNSEISLLQKELQTSQAQTKEEQNKLKKLAFAVHPEDEYETFRKAAYVDLFNKTVNSNLGNNSVVLVRVFNATAFRRNDSFFKDIQNDDIVLYENKTPGYVGTTRIAIVRPREQKIINSGTLAVYLIEQGRVGNVSSSPLGVKPLNFYSEQ